MRRKPSPRWAWMCRAAWRLRCRLSVLLIAAAVGGLVHATSQDFLGSSVSALPRPTPLVVREPSREDQPRIDRPGDADVTPQPTDVPGSRRRPWHAILSRMAEQADESLVRDDDEFQTPRLR